LASFNLWYIRQLGNLQIDNLHAGSLAYRSSVVWQLVARQLGSSADGQLGSSAARQLCKSDNFMTWQLGLVILYIGSWVAWHLGRLAAWEIGSVADYSQFYS
jgi:hypothetical protein